MCKQHSNFQCVNIVCKTKKIIGNFPLLCSYSILKRTIHSSVNVKLLFTYNFFPNHVRITYIAEFVLNIIKNTNVDSIFKYQVGYFM